jgi:hypothetical protein
MNGNPFYEGSLVPDVSDTILKVGDMRMRRDDLNDVKEYRKQQLGLEQQKLDMLKGQQQQQIPASKQPWDISHLTRLQNKLRLNGLDPDKMPEVFEPLKEMAQNPVMMRGDIASALEQGWDSNFKPAILNNLSRQTAALATKAGGMKDDDPKKREVLAEMEKLEKMQGAFAQLKPEHVVPGFFSDIAEERAQSKAMMEALQAKSRGATARPTVIRANPKAAGAAAEKKPSMAEERMRRKEIADAETSVLSNKDNRELGGIDADIFNSQADKPYVYLWDSESFDEQYKKFPLPKINGKQATARDVYFTAEQNGMTIEEVLEQLKGKQGKK